MLQGLVAKRWVKVLLILVGIVLCWNVILQTIYFFSAPTLSGFRYSHTSHPYVYMNDGETQYYYTATGTETELATKLTADVKGMGYIPNAGVNPGQASILCNDSFPGDDDVYYFAKPHSGYKYAPSMTVTFTPSSEALGGHVPVGISKLGCDRKAGTYTISLYTQAGE